MINKITEKISVNSIYNHLNNSFFPKYIKWHNRIYTIEKLGLHYTLFRGETLFHMFAVSNQNNFFLLAFNTKNLTWTLEEIRENDVN